MMFLLTVLFVAALALFGCGLALCENRLEAPRLHAPSNVKVVR